MAVEDSGTLRIRKKKGKQKLSQLIRGINAGNLHAESDWGSSVGKELW
jgi:antitoxin component of MazEF toxin-antitoxin module